MNEVAQTRDRRADIRDNCPGSGARKTDHKFAVSFRGLRSQRFRNSWELIWREEIQPRSYERS